MHIFPLRKKPCFVIGTSILLPYSPRDIVQGFNWIPMLRSVTWKRFGPLDNPQKLFFTQSVETVEEMGNIGLRVVMTCTYNLWLNVFQDGDDLLGELNLADARDASHGSQGLTVIGHGHVGLKHQGRSQAQGFHCTKTLQFPSWDMNKKGNLWLMIIMYCTNNTIVSCCIFLIRKTLFAPPFTPRAISDVKFYMAPDLEPSCYEVTVHFLMTFKSVELLL